MIDWEAKAQDLGYKDPLDMFTSMTDECASLTEVALKLGVSRAPVRRALAILGLEVNGKEAGPKCPNCKSTKSIVTYSESSKEGRIRRRLCKACGSRFKTVEKVMLKDQKWT